MRKFVYTFEYDQHDRVIEMVVTDLTQEDESLPHDASTSSERQKAEAVEDVSFPSSPSADSQVLTAACPVCRAAMRRPA